jgi:hypothetical protein
LQPESALAALLVLALPILAATHAHFTMFRTLNPALNGNLKGD